VQEDSERPQQLQSAEVAKSVGKIARCLQMHALLHKMATASRPFRRGSLSDHQVVNVAVWSTIQLKSATWLSVVLLLLLLLLLPLQVKSPDMPGMSLRGVVKCLMSQCQSMGVRVVERPEDA
jgi:hypothetical protein